MISPTKKRDFSINMLNYKLWKQTQKKWNKIYQDPSTMTTTAWRIKTTKSTKNSLNTKNYAVKP